MLEIIGCKEWDIPDGTLDFTAFGKPENRYLVRCGCCGNTSLVEGTHKRYCPVCGPDTITPIVVKKVTKRVKDDNKGMIDATNGMRIAEDACIAMDALEALTNSRLNLHPSYLKEKCETVQRCLDFMKSFYEKNENSDNSALISVEREYAIGILDIFENLLDEKGIDIPSDDRNGDEGEARIFGTEYADLEDKITELLIKFENELIRDF